MDTKERVRSLLAQVPFEVALSVFMQQRDEHAPGTDEYNEHDAAVKEVCSYSYLTVKGYWK